MPDPSFTTEHPSQVGGSRLEIRGGPVGDLERLYDPENIRRMLEQALSHMCAGGSASLSQLMRSGDQVVLKPNLLRHDASHSPEWRHVITHPALIGAVIDVVAPLIGPTGSMVVADGPQTDSSWATICRRTGLQRLVREAQDRHGLPISLLDLRQEEWTSRDGVVTSRQRLPGDPLGYCDIDLGTGSAFHGFSGEGHYYGASFDTGETNREHHQARHRYRLSRTVMDADLIINLPKLKTHKKAGITASLKNLVGVNGNKNWLPHYTMQQAGAGGDQYPPDAGRHLEGSLIRLGKQLLQRFPLLAGPLLPFKAAGRAVFGDTSAVVRSGNWSGNDTLWRMVLDLNRAVLWHDADGRPRSRARRYLTVVDAVVAGEGAGPEAPQPRPMGWILAGTDPVAVDAVAARLMGFPWQAIPVIARAHATHPNPLTTSHPEAARFVRAAGCVSLGGIPAGDITPCRPHFGWHHALTPALAPAGARATADPAHVS